jgi:hypothetical protein
MPQVTLLGAGSAEVATPAAHSDLSDALWEAQRDALTTFG